MKNEMTVTRALSELKLLNNKIDDGIERLRIASIVQNGKVQNENISPEEFIKRETGAIQSVNALISRRRAIKAALALSNAKTLVPVGDQALTVAEAIERKNSVVYEKELLSKLRTALAQAQNQVEYANSKVNDNLNRLLETSLGKETKKAGVDESSAVTAITEAYLMKNQFAVIAPARITEMVQTLADSIDSFLLNVDNALSVANATTIITFESD